MRGIEPVNNTFVYSQCGILREQVEQQVMKAVEEQLVTYALVAFVIGALFGALMLYAYHKRVKRT